MGLVHIYSMKYCAMRQCRGLVHIYSIKYCAMRELYGDGTHI